MKSDGKELVHGLIARRLQEAVGYLPPGLKETVRKRGLVGPLTAVLSAIFLNRDKYPALELATVTGSASEPVPIQVKEFVLGALGQGTAQVPFDIDILKQTADSELDKVLRSTGDLARFLEWFLKEPAMASVSKGAKVPRFRGYLPIGMVTLPLLRRQRPKNMPPETMAHIDKYERPYMDTVKTYLVSDTLSGKSMDNGLTLLKGLSEWVWKRVVENGACEKAFNISMPPRSGLLMDLVVAAVFSESPTIGLGILLTQNLQHTSLLGLRVSGEDYHYPYGKVLQRDVLNFLLAADYSQSPALQKLGLDYDPRDQKKRNNQMQTLLGSLANRCIDVAKKADDVALRPAGDDELLEGFRGLAGENRKKRLAKMIALADAVADGKGLVVRPVKVLGEEYSSHVGTLTLPLIALCDYVWSKATTRDELEIETDASLGLSVMRRYEDAVYGTPDHIQPYMCNAKSVDDYVGVGLVKQGTNREQIQAMNEYPFYLEEAGMGYNEATIWGDLRAELKKAGC